MFVEAMDAALDRGADLLADEARREVKRRAFNGNDGMLYFHTKKWDSTYRDNAPHISLAVGGPASVTIFLDDGTQPQDVVTKGKGES